MHLQLLELMGKYVVMLDENSGYARLLQLHFRLTEPSFHEVPNKAGEMGSLCMLSLSLCCNPAKYVLESDTCSHLKNAMYQACCQ
mmetsp:Transcript_1426/g.4858  ORF Transcript_1426/g.4858 Transcript_1426/m.4858 type:complete len:85 (+) Transcript_1426:1623-1877(+)